MTSRLLPMWLALGGLLALAGGGLGWLMLGFAGDYSGREFLPSAQTQAEFLAAPADGLTIRKVQHLPASSWLSWDKAGFVPTASDHSTWMRLKFHNPNSVPVHAVWENLDPHADRVEFFDLAAASVRPMLSGESVAFGEKTIPSRSVAFPISLPPHSERTVYARFEDHFGAYLSPVWWPRQEMFYAAYSRNTLAQGTYFGFLLALIFYNALIWLRIRFPDTGRYLLCLTSFTVYAFIATGGVSEIQQPFGSPWMETWATFTLALSGAFLAEFARTLLGLPSLSLRADRSTRFLRNVMAVLALGSLALSWAGYTRLLSYVVLAYAINHLLLLVIAMSAWRAGAKQARYFILAFGVVIIGFSPALALWGELLPLDILARTVMVGTALQMLLLSVATADRFALIQRDKLKAQEALVEETATREAIQEAYADELEVEVRERTSELASANADKDRMIAVLGHDLRGPLSGLTQTAELLTREAAPDGLERFAVDTARTGSQMLLLIEDLVLWAQLRAGNPDKTTCALSALVTPVVNLHHSLAEREGVELIVDASMAAHVFADLVLTQTLVRNLVVNAVKFATAKVVLGAKREEGHIRISVADDGPGIPAPRAAILTADTPINNGSSGLGLRLCREIAQVLGARFQVTTPAGGGTEISFLLPEAPAP